MCCVVWSGGREALVADPARKLVYPVGKLPGRPRDVSDSARDPSAPAREISKPGPVARELLDLPQSLLDLDRDPTGADLLGTTLLSPPLGQATVHASSQL